MPHFGPTLPPLRKVRESWEQHYPHQKYNGNAQYSHQNSQQEVGHDGYSHYQGQRQGLNDNCGSHYRGQQFGYGPCTNSNSFSSHSSDNSTQYAEYPSYGSRGESPGGRYQEQYQQNERAFDGTTCTSPQLYSSIHNNHNIQQHQNRESYPHHSTNTTTLPSRGSFPPPPSQYYSHPPPQHEHQHHHYQNQYGNNGLHFTHRNDYSSHFQSSRGEHKDSSDFNSSFGSHTSPTLGSSMGHPQPFQQHGHPQTGLRLPPRYQHYQHQQSQRSSPRSDICTPASTTAPPRSGLKLPCKTQTNSYGISSSSSKPPLSPSLQKEKVNMKRSVPPVEGNGLQLPKREHLEGMSPPTHLRDDHNRGIVIISSGNNGCDGSVHTSKSYSASPTRSIFRMRSNEENSKSKQVRGNKRTPSHPPSKSDARMEEHPATSSSSDGHFDIAHVAKTFQNNRNNAASKNNRGGAQFHYQSRGSSGREDYKGPESSSPSSPNFQPKAPQQELQSKVRGEAFRKQIGTPSPQDSSLAESAERTSIRFFNKGVEVGQNGVPLSISIGRNHSELADNEIYDEFEPPSSDGPENELDSSRGPLRKLNKNNIAMSAEKSTKKVEKEKGLLRKKKRHSGKKAILDKYSAEAEEDDLPHLQSEENLFRLEESKKVTSDFGIKPQVDLDFRREIQSPLEEQVSNASSTELNEKSGSLDEVDTDVRQTKKLKLDLHYSKKQKIINRANAKSQQPSESVATPAESGILSSKSSVGHGDLMRDIFGSTKTINDIGKEELFGNPEESNNQTVNAANVLVQMAFGSKTHSIRDID